MLADLQRRAAARACPSTAPHTPPLLLVLPLLVPGLVPPLRKSHLCRSWPHWHPPGSVPVAPTTLAASRLGVETRKPLQQLLLRLRSSLGWAAALKALQP